MNISCIGFELKILHKEAFKDYFQLLEKNKDHLKDFFPGTLKEMATLQMAQNEFVKMEQKFNHRELYPFGVYVEDSIIGYVCIKNISWRVPKGELAYFIDEDYQGKGMISSAVQAITEYAFNSLEMEKLFIRTGPDNIGSQKIATKCDFKKEGILRNEFRISTGELIDTIYFGKLRSDSISP